MEEQPLLRHLETAQLSTFHYGILAISSLAYALTGMGVMLISILITPTGNEWNLSSIALGLLASAGYVGMFLGAISFGSVADYVGRKKTLVATIIISSVFMHHACMRFSGLISRYSRNRDEGKGSGRDSRIAK